MATPAEIAADHGAPYPPQEQALGLVPAVMPDVPICAVFLFLFICVGAGHMTLFKLNLARGKKFIISGMVFGFCMTRIFATSLRIVWSFYPTSVKVGIAAMIFVYAGIVLLFLANLFFTQRIIRAQHPHFGWSKPFSILFPVLFVMIIGTILALIVGVIYSFYTLDEKALGRIRDIEVFGETLYAAIAFIPIPMVLLSAIARRHPSLRKTKSVDKFGSGSMRAKVIIVIVAAIPLCLGASWRAATVYLPSAPINTPSPWYYSKVYFYVFNFGIEVSVVFFWLVVRIDKRFFIPNGAKGPFSYGGGFTFAGEPGNEKSALANRESMRHLNGPGNTRGSWGASRSSLGRDSRMSWGGVSREDVHLSLAEDGIEVMPYPAFRQEADRDMTAADVGVDGAEAEMGFDPKSGKWALRPVSAAHIARPTSLRTSM